MIYSSLFVKIPYLILILGLCRCKQDLCSAGSNMPLAWSKWILYSTHTVSGILLVKFVCNPGGWWGQIKPTNPMVGCAPVWMAEAQLFDQAGVYWPVFKGVGMFHFQILLSTWTLQCSACCPLTNSVWLPFIGRLPVCCVRLKLQNWCIRFDDFEINTLFYVPTSATFRFLSTF